MVKDKEQRFIMSKIFRHDAISLHSDEKQENFVKFMKEELIPFFSTTFSGPTRSTLAYIQSQSLLKDTKDSLKWLWVTAWEAQDGNPKYVRGLFFEHTWINDESVGIANDILTKLEDFGRRSPEDLFSEFDATVVPPNP